MMNKNLFTQLSEEGRAEATKLGRELLLQGIKGARGEEHDRGLARETVAQLRKVEGFPADLAKESDEHLLGMLLNSLREDTIARY